MSHSNYRNNAQVLALLAALLFTVSASAVEPINATLFGNKAIKGYDPVAYFTKNAAIKGSKKYVYEWRGANWHFSMQEHLDMFRAAPEKYAPQYGGYCAYAVSQNDTATIDPSQFTIHADKLYLNYNKKINRIWLANKESLIRDADKYWPALVDD